MTHAEKGVPYFGVSKDLPPLQPTDWTTGKMNPELSVIGKDSVASQLGPVLVLIAEDAQEHSNLL